MNQISEFKQERLQKAIAESPLIQKMSRDPYLMELLSLLNRNQDLPRTKAELYGELSRILVYQWDTPVIARADREQILRGLAFFIKTNLKENQIFEKDLEEIIQSYLSIVARYYKINPESLAKDLINQLQENKYILRVNNNKQYSFVDLIFLDYFCAWKLIWKYQKQRTIDIQDYIERYKQEDNWQEVLSLVDLMLAV